MFQLVLSPSQKISGKAVYHFNSLTELRRFVVVSRIRGPVAYKTPDSQRYFEETLVP